MKYLSTYLIVNKQYEIDIAIYKKQEEKINTQELNAFVVIILYHNASNDSKTQ